jgi:hypothetical protein
MWKIKFMNIPVILGTIGIVTRGFKKNLEAIAGNKFNRFTTKESYACKITRNTGSIAV